MNLVRPPLPSFVSTDLYPWMDDAACKSAPDPDIWFSENLHETRDAVAVCHDCPVRLDCLRFAFELDISSGVWGGLTVRERRGTASWDKRRAIS